MWFLPHDIYSIGSTRESTSLSVQLTTLFLVKKNFDRNGEQKEAITRVSHSQIEMDLVLMNTSESKTLILVE